MTGMNKICGIAGLGPFLKDECHEPDTNENIAKFLNKCKVKEDGKNITKDRVGMMVKIHSRFKDPKLRRLIVDLDDKFGALNHDLGQVACLDILCSKTAHPKNVPLQDALLQWVVTGISLGALLELEDPKCGKRGIQEKVQ